ncbi:hypothetical protein CRUP_007297, partial [Coryphaenoides rupestris]
VECRAVMIFFHYCVLSNYFWLFIEGLYLFTLLVETFPERRYFYCQTAPAQEPGTAAQQGGPAGGARTLPSTQPEEGRVEEDEDEDEEEDEEDEEEDEEEAIEGEMEMEEDEDEGGDGG